MPDSNLADILEAAVAAGPTTAAAEFDPDSVPLGAVPDITDPLTLALFEADRHPQVVPAVRAALRLLADKIHALTPAA